MFTVKRIDERIYVIVKKNAISVDDHLKKLPFVVYGILKVEGTCYRDCYAKRQNISTKISENEIESLIEMAKRKCFL